MYRPTCAVVLLACALTPAAPGRPKAAPIELAPGETRVFKGHEGKVFAVAVSPDGSAVYSGGADKTLRGWPVQKTGKEKEQKLTGFGRPFGHIGSISFLHPSKSRPKSRAAVVLSGDTLWLADLAAGRGLTKLSDGIIATALSPDGKWVAGSYHPESTLLVWNAQTGAKSGKLQLQSKANAVGFNKDGTTVVVDTDQGDLRAYDLKSGKATTRYKGQPGLVQSIVFFPDGKRFLCAGHPNDVRMWDFATGKEEARFPGHNGGVSQVAITPDGKRFLAASADGVLRVWDVGTRKLVAESKGHEGAILAVAIAPNGTWAATAGADETVRLFGLPE